MCSENIYIAGRYNKFVRNLSQSPWIDKDDVRIRNSVQELIEEGLRKYLNYDKCVFSSSGREDVDVRMLGRGRPFVFKILNPFNPESFNDQTLDQVMNFVNEKHSVQIGIRDLQIVEKEGVQRNIKEGQEEKTKEYRALCCCSKKINDDDILRISKSTNLFINQKTPIRVLHRRTLASRRRKILRMKVEKVNVGDFDSVKEKDLDHVFALTLVTEAGTYIKEFVHGDLGRTEPSLSSILGNCETDIMELDVMEVYLDWPPPILRNVSSTENSAETKMDQSEINLAALFAEAVKAMKEAESLPRGDKRQESYMNAKRLFTRVRELVESLSLFSDNEVADDIATVDLKYLLIEAYLAKIAMSAECGPNRLETFSRAELLMKRFLTRIVKYGLGNEDIERALKSESGHIALNHGSTAPAAIPDLQSAMRSRDEKIEKYKKIKMLESRLEELERLVMSGRDQDEEVVREFYISLLKKWIQDTHESLEQEVKPALFFERNRATIDSRPEEIVKSHPSTSKRLSENSSKTITIVKDQLQKQVFGLGYPSKPTVTVDEFITKKMKDGELAFQTQKEVYANSLQRYAEKPNLLREQEELSDVEHDEKEEREDLEELKRKRQWDEFKDENPRGSGNRHNMG